MDYLNRVSGEKSSDCKQGGIAYETVKIHGVTDYFCIEAFRDRGKGGGVEYSARNLGNLENTVNRNQKCSNFGKKSCSDFGNSLCSINGNNNAVTVG